MNLSCESVRERLADLDASGELTAHLRTCEACRAFAASLDAVDGELDSLPAIDAPDALVESTLARIAAEEAGAREVGLVSSPSILVAAFAVLASAVGALVVAPLTFVQWIGHVARRSGQTPSRQSPADSPLRSPGP